MSETRRTIENLEDFVSGLMVDLTNSIHGRLFESNPVDTGFSQSNWLASIGESIDSPVGIRDSVDMTSWRTLLADINGYDINQGSIFITNSVDYVVFLDQGSSLQAPQGFVRQSIVGGISDVVR